MFISHVWIYMYTYNIYMQYTRYIALRIGFHTDGSPWFGKTRWSRAVRCSEMVTKDCDHSFFMFPRWSHDIFFQSSLDWSLLVLHTWKDGLNLYRYNTQAIRKQTPSFTAFWPKMMRSRRFCKHERVQILLWICLSIRTYISTQISFRMLFPKMFLLQCNHNNAQFSSKHPPFH